MEKKKKKPMMKAGKKPAASPAARPAARWKAPPPVAIRPLRKTTRIKIRK